MRRNQLVLVTVTTAFLAVAPAIVAADSWPQWGGPDRDFSVDARELSKDWGDDGPPQLWTRPLGGGFSAIVSDGKRLVTMYRDGDDELIVAMDPATGKTLWETRYAAPIPDSQALTTQYGRGPNGTPLLIDGKVITLGFTGHLHCVDAAKGTELWSHDLGKEFEVKIPYFGHATSPMAVGKNVIVLAGGVFSFDIQSGDVTWLNRETESSYGSPRTIEVAGKTQIVTAMTGSLVGINPLNGKTLWTQEHKNQWGTILTTPLIDDRGRVFISASQVGSVLVDPTATKADERAVWTSKATQINHSNAVRSGDWVFGTTGDSATFLSATSLKDGTQAWKERGFAQSNLLRVGDRYLLLDFDGELALLDLNEKGMKVLTQSTINDAPTWTPPTLIGTTLYVRDESRIMALDLAPQGSAPKMPTKRRVID